MVTARRFFSTALILALVLGSAPASSNIFVSDDRIDIIRQAGTIYASVGVITHIGAAPAPDQWRFGTATLISPCHALTAHHTAFASPAFEGPDEGSLLHFGPPRADGFPFSWSVKAKPVLWGALADHAHEDWAVLELEECLGTQLGWWQVTPMQAEAAIDAKGWFFNAGHPADAARQTVKIDPACSIHRQVGSVPGWRHDCATEVGVSGGPIFYLDAEARPHIVAIVKGDFFTQQQVIPRWHPAAANVAIPVGNFAAELGALIEAGLQRAAEEQPR